MTELTRCLLALLFSGCVVTTLEGPGDPPRVAPPPGAKSAESGAPKGPHEIRARHLLVAYLGSERASPEITRTREEARIRAEEALRRARAGEPFEVLVTEYSDEPGAAERGGDLGKFRRNMMVRPFADAAFSLGPGELSDVVETPFGYHVIQRTE